MWVAGPNAFKICERKTVLDFSAKILLVSVCEVLFYFQA